MKDYASDFSSESENPSRTNVGSTRPTIASSVSAPSSTSSSFPSRHRNSLRSSCRTETCVSCRTGRPRRRSAPSRLRAALLRIRHLRGSSCRLAPSLSSSEASRFVSSVSRRAAPILTSSGLKEILLL